MLKATAGIAAELEPEHCAPVGDRQVLLRLQNNIKLRLVKSQRLDRALSIVEGMLLFAPDCAELWHEAGLLHAYFENYGAALGSVEGVLRRAGGTAARQRTTSVLHRVQGRPD